jgi:serine/threonine protein kinase
MPLSSARWHVITESSFPWEQDALEFVRERLPDQDPYHAWTNFEFIAEQGSVYEVDLLVLAPSGFYLIEIKSRPGVVEGDGHTWTWRDQGNEYILDNPLLLTNRKAKRLISLLRQQRAVGRMRLPFLEPLVFCSAAGLKVKLQGPAAAGVRVRDRDQDTQGDRADGIIKTLTQPPRMDPGTVRIDVSMARAIARAMEQAGIRRSQKARRVGDYQLGALIQDGPAFQDYKASHVALTNVNRRIRLYQIPRGAPAEVRRMIVRAAQREFQILEGLTHPGILRVVDYKDHEHGPALVFEHRPDAVRLDHFLAQQGARLSLGDRLGLLRQLAEAVKYAHDKRLIHRALGPQSVLVLNPDSPGRRLQIFNWQVGARESGTTTGRSVTATSHLEQLVAEETTIYLAPEALTDPGAAGEYLDVFSLGAIAYHLFSGQPPARSVVELSEKLREERGLQLSAVLDGTGTELHDLVAWATHPDVSVRLGTVDDFLQQLERVEEEVTRPEEPIAKNPTEALTGDELPGGLRVTKRLGRGSSSIVFLVSTSEGRELVLKVAASPDANDRLRQEADILRDLRHQHIVAFHELREIEGHAAILMDRAGEKTLADRLREEGALHLELLERFGEDLLQTVSWLEQRGIPHRDIKPGNIGIAEVGAENRLHLVLFDFSLSRTPLDAIRAGTVPYLDPFLSLRKPPRWDLAAERFAAAVTLYEMATARVPVWGDGRSDPAVIEQEVSLDPGVFDPDLRERMLAFFQRALRRHASERFDNADEMLAAWRKVFAGADRTRDEASPAHVLDFTELVAQVTRETALGQIGLSTRALNALERQHVLTAGGLVGLPSRRLYAMPGVGSKTRAEIRAAKDALARRLGAMDQVPLVPTTTTTTGEEAAEVVSIDLLMARLLPRGKRVDSSELRILARFLSPGAQRLAEDPWPKQSDVAQQLGLTRARIGQVVTKARARWIKDPSITRLRNDVAELLEANGRVMTAAELAQALLTTRGSEAPEPLRTERAMAVARAAIEAERERTEPRFTEFRLAALLVALDEPSADYAARLGGVADRLAASDPLLPPARVLEDLGTIDPPELIGGLTPARLTQLAASASTMAAASSRLEIYPRKMPAERALRLAQGALLGVRHLTVLELRDRVSGRYPEAEPLPERPELDGLLRRADLGFEWDPQALDGRGAYMPRVAVATLVSSSTSIRTRSTGAEGAGPVIDEDAQRFEERLRYCLRQGSFQALGVPPKYLLSAERRLARKFAVRPVSLEALLITEMKQAALQAGAQWVVVRDADAVGPKGPHWLNLLRIVGRAITGMQVSLTQSEQPLLLGYPGLLARYDRLDLLEHLRDRSGARDGPPGVWLLLPTDDQQELPAIDGRGLPLISSSQWARIPEAWIHDAAA